MVSQGKLAFARLSPPLDPPCLGKTGSPYNSVSVYSEHDHVLCFGTQGRPHKEIPGLNNSTKANLLTFLTLFMALKSLYACAISTAMGLSTHKKTLNE